MAFAGTASAAPDNLGNDFWLAFAGNFNGGADKTLFLTGPTAATGTVAVPGLSFSQNFSVTPGTVTPVSLPAADELSGGDTVEAKGIHVTSDNEVAAYGLSRIQFTTDAYLGLPTDTLGTHYIDLGFGTGLGGNSEFAVSASANGTTVTITPTVATQGGHAAGTPFNVSLNQGDAYQLRAANANDDLSGTIVASDKPVGVFGGHQCANIPNDSFVACDHVVEQLPPEDDWGKSFLSMPLKTRTGGDTFRILASADGTQVQVNGSVVANLNRGQLHQQIIDGPASITADKPVLVAQYSNSSSFDGVTSDPFMMLVPPFEQFQNGYTVTTPSSGFASNFINLVVPDSAVGNVQVDGTAVPAGNYTAIGSSGFSGTQVDVAPGSHNLTGGGQPFGAFVYGFANFDSYGYPGGLSLAPVARVAKIAVNPPTATNPVNTQHCVTATALDQNNQGVPDVRVDFAVTGANTASGSQTADAAGNAQFCYTGTSVGSDTITASVGSVSGTATKDWIVPVPVTKVIKCQGPKATIVGTPGNDTLIGTEKADVIAGQGGNDLIKGLGGNDKICGKEGNDHITGAAGNDKLHGGPGKDTESGGDGKDMVQGGGAADKLKGNDGKDNVRGGSGKDKMSGGAGNDLLKAHGGGDHVQGNGGNDKLGGGAQFDHLNGGAGNNKCSPGPDGAKLVNCVRT